MINIDIKIRDFKINNMANLVITENNDLDKSKNKFDISNQELLNNLQELEELDTELKDLKLNYDDNVKLIQKKKNKIYKELNNLSKKICVAYNKDISMAKKEKRKRKVPVSGGIMKVIKVPKVICKYTGIDDDISMSRPQIITLLNDKFKKDGFRNGQEIHLNKKIAKLFGKKVGKNKKFIIGFSEFQKFLSEIIQNDNKNDNSDNKIKKKVINLVL